MILKFRIAVGGGIVGMMWRDDKNVGGVGSVGGKARLAKLITELVGRGFEKNPGALVLVQKNVIRFNFDCTFEEWTKGIKRIEAEGVEVEQVKALGRVMI